MQTHILCLQIVFGVVEVDQQRTRAVGYIQHCVAHHPLVIHHKLASLSLHSWSQIRHYSVVVFNKSEQARVLKILLIFLFIVICLIMWCVWKLMNSSITLILVCVFIILVMSRICSFFKTNNFIFAIIFICLIFIILILINFRNCLNVGNF